MEKVNNKLANNIQINMENKNLDLPDSITGASKGLRIRIPKEKLIVCSNCFESFSLSHFITCPDIRCEQ
jgi:hypothetical protein